MKKKSSLYFLCAILLSSLLAINVLPVHGQPSITIEVARVVWGEDPDNPIKAYPGDEGVALTVEAQNYSNETIKGVKAVLMLENSPFTDAYGKPNATATGEPKDVGDIMNQTGEILPVGFFTLTFSLNIHSNATPGSYSYNMTLDYFWKSEGFWLRGETSILNIEFIVSKAQTTITCSVSPQSVEKGESVDISGSTDPVQENATVTLAYKRPNGSTFNETVRTQADGSYRKSYQPDVEGSWTINVSWPGDGRYEGDWASASFEVKFPVSLRVIPSDNRLTGGLDNQFNITLLNSGGVLLSTIDVTLTTPSPLIVHGDNHWTFKSLEPGNSTLIPVEIYAPVSSIGTTYSGSLNLNYRDDYGESHSDSYPIGLIVGGRIELDVYDKIMSPQPAKPGSKVSITATLLNKGNIAAMYVNASIMPNAILDLTTESGAYVGEVEENSPVPFTLTANVNTNTQNGTYPITISITYRDDQYVDHSFNVTVILVVEKGDSIQADHEMDLFKLLTDVGWILLLLVGASVIIAILYRRRLSRQLTIQTVPSGGRFEDERFSAF